MEVRCRIDDADLARDLVDAIVTERLAACAHVEATAPARYWWQGAVVHDDEVEMRFIVSRAGVEALVQALGQRHRYDLPGITWSAVATTAQYAAWVEANTAQRA